MDQVFDTSITRMFGIRHPILLGGMMWLSDASLVAAVVNAGAMGFITALSFGKPDRFREELRACRRLTRERPFGVNLTISARLTDHTTLQALLDVALDEGVRHFETAGSPPPAGMLDAIHAKGGILIHKVPKIRHAQTAERLGVDAVTIVGIEEGGHPGGNELPTFVNGAFALPRLSIPLVLGGGIGSGRQIAAALALGAGGVVMGSFFTVAEETTAHRRYKERIVEVDENCSTTAMSSISTWRVLINDTVREVQRREAAGARTFADFADIIRGTTTRDKAYGEGDWNQGMVSLSSAAGFADRICPAAELVDRLMSEAAAAADGFRRLQVATSR